MAPALVGQVEYSVRESGSTGGTERTRRHAARRVEASASYRSKRTEQQSITLIVQKNASNWVRQGIAVLIANALYCDDVGTTIRSDDMGVIVSDAGELM